MPGRIPQWGLDDRLRKVRRDMGMTQEELAAALGVGAKAYGAWEAGTNRPSDVLEVAQKMEMVSGVPRQWFIGWIDDSSSSAAGMTGAVGPAGFEPTTSSVYGREFGELIPFPARAKAESALVGA